MNRYYHYADEVFPPVISSEFTFQKAAPSAPLEASAPPAPPALNEKAMAEAEASKPLGPGEVVAENGHEEPKKGKKASKRKAPPPPPPPSAEVAVKPAKRGRKKKNT